MKLAPISALAIIALPACAAEAGTPPPSRAELVVAASKRATGGAAWDMPQGCHEEGTRGGGVAYTTRFSLKHYGMRVDSERGGHARSMGFNGKIRWQAGDEGKAEIRTDADAVKDAVLTAYLSNNGFFFPDRFPATFTYTREAKVAGHIYDVLTIRPEGGRPLEAWFDRGTHFIRRVIDANAAPPVTVEASDYRSAGGLTVAFKLTVIGPNGAVVDNGAVTSFQCGPIDEAIFDPPKPR